MPVNNGQLFNPIFDPNSVGHVEFLNEANNECQSLSRLAHYHTVLSYVEHSLIIVPSSTPWANEVWSGEKAVL